MKNSLLIHNNNVPFLNEFDYQIVFKSNSVDIDKYISNIIIPQIIKLDFKIIYIKDNLSSNYLEFYGIHLAYYIRLSQILLPIVILSDLDILSLNKLNSMSRIFFSKNIFIQKNNSNFSKIDISKIKPFKGDDYKNKFLDLIEVFPPKDYLSHHNISNEWAIYRWAEFLNIKDSKAINQNREKISLMLYFKYLLAKNPIPKKNGILFVPQPPKNSGKILYIDDEWAKGWSDIFRFYFSKNPNIKFDSFKYNFKDNNKSKIISDIEKKIKKYNPDLVILDLRLTKSDHNKNQEIEKLTGIIISKSIKELNPAIQIIILSATSKSTILENLYKYNILGYIKKEHPTDINISTKDNFNKLKSLVDIGLKKSYLKEIWEIQTDILKLDLFNQDDISFIKIEFEIGTIFNILNSNLKNKTKFTLITIFKIFEILTEKYNLIGSEFLKIKKLFHNNGLKNYDDDISQIVCSRNFIVHSGNKSKLYKGCLAKLIENPNSMNILTWFKMLKTILESINDKSNS